MIKNRDIKTFSWDLPICIMLTKILLYYRVIQRNLDYTIMECKIRVILRLKIKLLSFSIKFSMRLIVKS